MVQKVIQCEAMWNVESAVDDREEWSLLIFSVKKDAYLSAKEDAGGEEGRLVVGLR